MDKRTEDPRRKGDIAEKLFELECIKRDIPVYAPVNSGSRDDYVIVIDGEFKKVQVKYKCEYKDTVSADFIKTQNGRSHNLKYTQDEIDMFFVYNPDKDEWYNIPMSLSESNNSVTIRTTPPKNNQTKNVNMREDFIW